jgi:hypothetical protein
VRVTTAQMREELDWLPKEPSRNPVTRWSDYTSARLWWRATVAVDPTPEKRRSYRLSLVGRLIVCVFVVAVTTADSFYDVGHVLTTLRNILLGYSMAHFLMVPWANSTMYEAGYQQRNDEMIDTLRDLMEGEK